LGGEGNVVLYDPAEGHLGARLVVLFSDRSAVWVVGEPATSTAKGPHIGPTVGLVSMLKASQRRLNHKHIAVEPTRQ
jgi:hypothetical protein